MPQPPRRFKLAQTLGLAGLFVLAASSAFADDGEGLAIRNQCMTCHKVKGTLVGPSYRDVASKYQADAGAPDKLIAKVRQGGKGVWGPMPMPPNSSISEADLKTIIDWILTQ